jgi:aminopeptidase N
MMERLTGLILSADLKYMREALAPMRARFALLLLLSAVPSLATITSRQAKAPLANSFDVLHYDARVEPDISGKTVKGTVRIKLAARTGDLAAIEFNCGDLVIDAVREGGRASKFTSHDHKLSIRLSRPAKANETREIEVDYHGAPRRAVRFFPEQMQVYTVFSTSQWLVCLDEPEDKATLRLSLILPADLSNVANGRLTAQRTLPGGKILYEWSQQTPVSTYTFGFAAGRFRVKTESHGHRQLRYLASQFSDEEVRRIFRDTADMVSYYEDRAGVRLPGAAYTQVLAAGGVEQEMSGFTVMRETYGREVLANPSDVWLAAHELAHQWWGNQVTCKDWTHFWLNEGIATFMAAAYKEHRFGRQEYEREIEESRLRYEKVRDEGRDRSLVFPDWTRPTAEDRTLVYHKGAYVLHLLRAEMGERAFWAGIRKYTRDYFGKSVITADFQTAMEQASGKSLKAFFSKWIYLK